VVDVATGILTALGIVAALYERERAGRARRVGSALLDTSLALQASIFTYGSVQGRDPERVGNGSYFTITDCLPTRDGHVVISLPTSRFWTRLCRALREPALERDPRFATHRGRIVNKTALGRALARVFRRRTTAAWLETLRAEDVPCGPVLAYHDVPGVPQVRHNGMLSEDRYGAGAPYRVVRSPVRLDGRLMDGDVPAPGLGADSAEVLRSAGFTGRQIEELDRIGVTLARPIDLEKY
jgi:crotonobetainyl-CoA:carnitine CoA-transferase CaiB-like acyl-CoA transferase